VQGPAPPGPSTTVVMTRRWMIPIIQYRYDSDGDTVTTVRTVAPPSSRIKVTRRLATKYYQYMDGRPSKYIGGHVRSWQESEHLLS
jgi:hypothetical protein